MKRLIVALILLLTFAITLASCGGTGDSAGNGSNETEDSTGGNTGSHLHEYPEEWERISFATCKKKGVSRKKCIICGEKSIYQYDEMLPHTVVKLEAIEGSCTQDGYTEGEQCSVCKTIITERVMTPKDSYHQYTEFVSIDKEPSLTSSGKATFKCSLCGATNPVEIDQYQTRLLKEKDIYNVETDTFNPAIDNRWKVFDGNKNTTGIYNTGDDWFGNEGDVLKITLMQEMVISELKLYIAGNWTFANVRLRDVKGNLVKEYSGVKANGAAYGGAANEFTVWKDISQKAYIIEIEITDNKNSYMNFKVAEIEVKAAKTDTRLPHTHDYRDFVKTTQEATCRKTGLASYACFCGGTKELDTPRAPHSYTILDTYVAPTCTTNGKTIYKCECGLPKEKTIESKGHMYEKLIGYLAEPTLASAGHATYKCIGCELTVSRDVAPLPIEELKHLRVEKIENGKVTIKFNVYGELPSVEIRYSESPIFDSNFNSAEKITGSREITATLDLDASLDKCYYVAIRPYNGSNYGKILTARVGGNSLIPIDYSSATVYHGEVLNSFAVMFDEQSDEYRTGSKAPETVLEKIFRDENDKVLYGSNLSPIIDLEYGHYVSSVYLYFKSFDQVSVRWSDTPVDFMAEDSEWDGVRTFTPVDGWNEVKLNTSTRYIQVVFKDGSAPYEVLVYGYQAGDGDVIATDERELPTVGELMGMCGFVASGAGNTPIESISCTNVLRDYHSFEWTYDSAKYPYLSSYFTGWMGNFDEKYRDYSQSGILVIPCFQWKLEGTSVSHKVGDDNLPVKNGNSYVKASFWERFDPHTYFTYSDAMFVFSARYGSTGSSELLSIVEQHTDSEMNAVGLGYIKWLELGNEPDGTWNGIHNYLSAYQLAAITSAGYDGHCKTMTSPVIRNGYHLGAKNADPNMKVAMAGISAASNDYIMSMCYWMKANRPDASVAIDAFNVHQYMSKQITLPNGEKAYVGMSPDEADLAGILSRLVAIRDKYFTDKEVWLTEFGWDTNQSYATTNSSHAYGDYTGRQVQAMWLTRAYLILSASGVDKATMYMCEDVGTVESEAVGKFATSGVIGFEYNQFGDVVEFKKDSYYYLYTLKNTLGGYTFEKEIEAYDEDVVIYKYTTDEGKTAYALWCKTSDGTISYDYQLKIDGDSATLVEAVYGDIDGVESALEADEYSYVSVNVSENPVYILVD